MSQVKDEPWVHDSGVGGTAVGHMWADPKNDQASSYLDANSEEDLKIDDISSVFHYDLITKYDSSYMAGEENQECGVFNGVLCEDELGNLPLAICPLNVSEDYALDFDFTKKVPELDFKFCDELCFRDSRSELNSPGTGNDVNGLSESSALLPICFKNQLRQSTASLMHDASGSQCVCQTPAQDRMGLICDEERMNAYYDKQDVPQIDDGQCLQYTEVTPVDQCTEAEASWMDELSTNNISEVEVGQPGQRKWCKPPQKYIDMVKPRCSKQGKCGTSSLKTNNLGVQTQATMGLVCYDDRMNAYCSLSRDKRDVIEVGDELCKQNDEGNHVNQCTEAQAFLMDELSTNSLSEEKVLRPKQRRLCKPSQKYTERDIPRRGRPKNCDINSLKDKNLGVRSQKKLLRKSSKIKSANGSGKNMELDSDEEYKPLSSASNVLRKDHKMWTLDEVVQVVDGVAQFGQGQWTAIKRALFPSSRRTPTDIRDKWRNLVKTNCRDFKRKREGQSRTNGFKLLPEPVTERVKELANIPKYSSRRGKMVSNTSPSLTG